MSKKFMGTILLVEDDPVNARLSRHILEKYGYNVIWVDTGEEGVEAVKGIPEINLVLMDIDLGNGIDGTEAAERILENKDIPLMFLSSHTEPEIVEKTEGITSYGYMVKNSGETVLIASLKMAFRLYDSRKEELKKEKKLIEGEERNRALLDGIPDMMFLFSRDGIIIDFNAFDLKKLIAPPEVFLNRHVSEVLPPEIADITMEKINSALSSGEIQLYEYSAEINNNISHFESRLVPCGEDKSLSIVRDITEQKKSAEALRDAEETYRNLFMNSHVGLYKTDLDTGLVLEANDMFAHIFGFKNRDDILSANVSVASWYADPDVRENLTAILKRDGEVKNYEVRLKRLNGSFFWIHLSGRIIPGKGWIEGVLEDITDRKLAEIKLSISENKYRKIFENVQDVFYQTDLEGTIIEISPSIQKYSGHTREELIGVPVQNVYSDGNDRENLVEILKCEGKIVDYELKLKKKDNSDILVSASSHMIFNSSGIPFGVEGSLRDISQRKAAEEKIKALLREKELLLKETHHRIKNNMNAVYGMLYMQAEEIDNRECTEVIKDAASRVQSMAVLYDKLYRSPDYKKLSIADYFPPLIDEISFIFDPASLVKFELHIDDFVLSSEVLSSLGIIINELITNSLKHAFKGQDGVIGISASRKLSDVTVTYKDNGVGLPESESFENSTGFGMQLVNMLVQQIGGTVEITRNNGTRFFIKFQALDD